MTKTTIEVQEVCGLQEMHAMLGDEVLWAKHVPKTDPNNTNFARSEA